MKALFFDCFSGASGNMLLGALLDLGYPVEKLHETIAALGLGNDLVSVQHLQVKGLAATLVTVANPPDQPHRHLADIESILSSTTLPNRVKASAIAVFRRLAQAEANVHGTSVDQIHFHEVGAIDAMVDIVGTCAAVAHFGPERILCSPLPLGFGTVKCAHGTLPVPVPATLELVRDVPTYSAERQGEHVTPTGAALVTELADEFVRFGVQKVERIGYGAGTRTFETGPPNLLRVILGRLEQTPEGRDELVIETNIDDMNPEFYGPLTEKLFEAGALDVTLTPCFMKKGRPGTLVTVIGGKQTLHSIAQVLFSDSTTIGLRTYPVSRLVCDRTWKTVLTAFGEVRIKISQYQGHDVGAKPEFDDCRKLAAKAGVAVADVYHAAMAKYLQSK